MSFLGRIQNAKIRSQAGDTIVEVLICIAILGGVMGGAYAIANQNSRINQSSQERLSATKVAESQLELLKGYASQSPNQAFNISSQFCLYYDSASALPIRTVASTDARCRLNSAGEPAAIDPSYSISMQKEGPAEQWGIIQIGQRYKIVVSWDNIIGNGQGKVTYSYGIYK